MIPDDTLVDDVEAFLSLHAPDWSSKSVQPWPSSGTDNALFLLGNDCVLRLPSRSSAVESLEKELVWLPKLTGLPLAVPKVLFHGQVKAELGFEFGILTWLEGSDATPGAIEDRRLAAGALAHFLSKLRSIPTEGAPLAGPENSNRGVELATLSEKTLASIEVLADEIHADAARRIWEQACLAPFEGQPTWVHGDLKADNMLAKDGQLTAVIDWGLAAVGDPAVDIAAAWTWVEQEARPSFKSASGVDDATWTRARGWALYCSVIALSYYRGRSHETLCAQSRRTLRRLGVRRG